MPEVSVVIPAYNYAEYTKQAVESVLAQTFKDFELIVVDDGSTDSTKQLLQEYGSKLNYIYKANGGAASARNVGIRSARGKYIALLDCDDLWLPTKLEETLKGFTNENVGLVYTDINMINEKGEPVSKNKIPGYSGMVIDKLLVSNFIYNPTVLIAKNCFECVGLFDEKLFFTADWDMWLRIAEKYAVKYIDRPLSKYRMVRDYRKAHSEEARKDYLAFLAKAWERNPNTPAKLKRKALSIVHTDMIHVYYQNRQPLALAREALALLFHDPIGLFSLIGGYFKKKGGSF